ncbi:hypothetical protein PPYR_11378 [Photinus pyralis]|uniref:RRM domain-containing protein n=1 Tax=Photinus pyralis TaxID=7054 RepID=A0A1Y1MTN4_PHOPY|nr:RNA-binding protein 34 [Photinus pyralis]KAB0794539.1 hypothetical protein PPYR_11378 [Photinus pyralis]
MLASTHKKPSKKLKKQKLVDATGKDQNSTNAHSSDVDVKSRTLFVGNVGVTAKKTHLLKLFRQFGKVQTVRLRGITPADPGTSKRLAAIRESFHPKRTSCCSYVVFENREDALNACSLNGTKFKENILRVQICDDNAELEPSKALFIGNVPFDAEENDLWNTFETFGQIESVRLIRNSETGMCIGVGFVNFKSTDGVALALMADSVQVKNREVRVQRYARTKMKKWQTQQSEVKPVPKKEKKPKERKRKEADNAKVKKSAIFQGSKVHPLKQKKKRNKKLSESQKMIQQIAPR